MLIPRSVLIVFKCLVAIELRTGEFQIDHVRGFKDQCQITLEVRQIAFGLLTVTNVDGKGDAGMLSPVQRYLLWQETG